MNAHQSFAESRRARADSDGCTRPRRVIILSEKVPHYREPFYARLREELENARIHLELIHSDEHAPLAVPWARRLRPRHIRLLSRNLCWQPVLSRVRDADLVIVEQASRMLVNYVLLAYQGLGAFKVAFWGHGKSFRPRPDRIGEAIKRGVSTRAHWWFAYNAISARAVTRLGFPSDRITIVNNSIDTGQLSRRKAALTREELRRVGRNLGIQGSQVGIFVGGMDAEKRLSYLLKACRDIRARVPGFEMIFIGDGPDRVLVREAARAHSWIHDVGPLRGPDTVPYYALSKLLLMPGRVGLVALDTLALQTPLVTTAFSGHSPEIDYLQPGSNCRLVESADQPSSFADAVSDLLEHESARQALVEGCRGSADQYSIERMARLFSIGIRNALNYPRSRYHG